MKKQLLLLSPIFLFFTILTFFVADNFFFWDTIKLVSFPANYIFDNNFQTFFLADEFDTGHMPVFPFYIALCWALFSKTLLVSHFAMLPFVFGIIWQVYLLVSSYVSNKKTVLFVTSLALLNPIFLSQATLVSLDIPLVFFFLMGLNTLKFNKTLLYAVAIIGLVAVSTRGVMMVVVLFVVEFFSLLTKEDFSIQVKNNYNILFKYLGGIFLFVLFNYLHYQNSGWILLNPNPNWSAGHVSNNLKGALFNLPIFAWRLNDFGMFFVWIALVVLLLKNWSRLIVDRKIKTLVLPILVLGVAFLLLYLRYSYFTLHRYLLPIYLLVSIFTGYLIVEYVTSKKIKNTIFGLLFIGLLSGNFWVYPNKIAQGWDSTLAHLPYYALQHKMLAYLEVEKIAIDEVGGEFPNLGEQRYIMLNDNHNSFKAKEVGVDKYILYSIINNDFSDDELDLLETQYSLKKEFKSVQIFVRLYQLKR